MTPASAPKGSPVEIEVIAFNGWQNNLRLCNGTVELVVTLDVGPRILSYKKCGGFNPLKIFEDQAGTTGEPAWKNRGGHRLWIAPEDKVLTYFPDNAPVTWEQLGDRWVKLVSAPETTSGYQKEIEISLEPEGTGVTLLHRLTRTDSTPGYLSAWALTVMAAGGMAVVPQPELGQHPRDLLPNRNLVLWPYTDMSDPRWRFGRKYILLKQDASGGPTKIGLAHAQGWSGYLVGGVFFLKRYQWNAEAIYPDRGSNFEMFTNARMLELESLGPLTNLRPGQSLEHIERWELHDGPASLDATDPEGQLDKFLGPILKNQILNSEGK